MGRLSKDPIAKKAPIPEDLEAQRKDLEPIRNVEQGIVSVGNIWTMVKDTFTFLGRSIEGFVKFVPPLEFAVSGFFTILDLVEAVLLSEKIRALEAVKIFNSITSLSLGIASLILTLNPATAPLGAILSISAIGVSCVKYAYSWYVAGNELAAAKTELLKAQEANETTKCESLNKKVYQCEKKLSSEQTRFYMNIASLACAVALVLTGIAAVTAIFNPVGLGIFGLSLLALTTAKVVNDTFFTKPVEVLADYQNLNKKPDNSNDPKKDNTKKVEVNSFLNSVEAVPVKEKTLLPTTSEKKPSKLDVVDLNNALNHESMFHHSPFGEKGANIDQSAPSKNPPSNDPHPPSKGG